MGADSGIIKFLLWNIWNLSTSSLSASSEADVEHLVGATQISARNTTWRSTGLTNQWLKVDLGASHTIGALAIVYPHNWPNSFQILSTSSDLSLPTSAATVRVRVSNNANLSSPTYDSGIINVWQSVLTLNELIQGQDSEFFNENGGPNETTRTYLSGMTRVFIIPSEISGRYVQFDLSDPTNSKSYMDISYIYVGRYFEPNPDLLYGWKLGRNEAARTPKASGGTMWASRIFQRTKLSLILAPQKESNITSYWALLSMLVGTRNEMIVQVRDINSSFKFFTTIYGRFTDTMKFTAVGFKNYSLPLQIEEIIA